MKSISRPVTGLVGFQLSIKDQVEGIVVSICGGGGVDGGFPWDLAKSLGVVVGSIGYGVGVAGMIMGVGVGKGVGKIAGVDFGGKGLSVGVG